MRFGHSPDIRHDFPELSCAVLAVEGVSATADVAAAVARREARIRERLAASSEGELPEVQAWRRAFSRMGLKPTQIRCASEALLRRFRKEDALPRLHPLVDLCNAASAASGIPIAVFDLARIEGDLEVRRAAGTEAYETFAGEVETPEPGEVVFADAAGSAHARRWCNRQSGRSAVRGETARALIVAEAMHDGGAADVDALVRGLAEDVAAAWAGARIRSWTLSPAQPSAAV
jgi:DNA/RNA-binding domain of Phe-tRNA-synthetase-like protein